MGDDPALVPILDPAISRLLRRSGSRSRPDRVTTRWPRCIAAFLFGTIALGGLGGHAVSVHVWQTSRILALLIGAICISALVVNLSNSLGAIAGRTDKSEAERMDVAAKIKDARALLIRKTSERDRLPAFDLVTPVMVRASEAAVSAAETSRIAECERRGSLCRQRETEEQNRRTELAAASRNAAATDRAERLDREIASLQHQIAQAGPAGAVNPQGAVLARLFRLPDTAAAMAATWQQFAVAVIVELLIVGAFVSFELMGKGQRGASTVVDRPAPMMISSPRPQLVTSAGVTIGSVPAIVADILHPQASGRVELADVFAAYAEQCKVRGQSPLPPAQFVDPLRDFCRACKIATRTSGGRVYLMGVNLDEVANRASA